MASETVPQLVRDRARVAPALFPPRAARRTATNVACNVVGNLLQAASQGVILVLLARLSGTESLGAYALGLAISAPIVMLANANLRTLLATERDRANEFRDYLGLRLLGAGLAAALVAAIAWSGWFAPEVAWAITLVGMHKALGAVSDIFHGLYQQHERADRIARSLVWKACLAPAMLALVLVLGFGLVEALAAMALSGAVVLLLFEVPWARQFAPLVPRLDRRVARGLVAQAIPLGIMSALISLSANVPRQLLAATHGTEILAHFAVLAYFLQAESMVVISAQQAMGPVLARHYVAGRSRFTRSVVAAGFAASGIGLAATLLAWLVAPWLLGALFGAEYAGSGILLAALMLAAVPLNLRCFLRAGLTVMRATRVQAPMALCDVIVSVALAAVLIPAWGLAGAVWTSLLTAVFSAALLASTLARRVRLAPEPAAA